MLEVLLSDTNYWFSIALATVAILFVLELVGLIFGISLIGILDDLPNNSIDVESGSVLAIGNWLNFNRIPLLIWLVVFLTSFGLLGFMINFTTKNLLSFTLPVWLSLTVVGFTSLIVTSRLSILIARVLPKFQSSAVNNEDFIGAVAHITIGSASKGNPAEAKFTDSYTQAHYVLVEPFEENELFLQGERVILVKKTDLSWLATRYQ